MNKHARNSSYPHWTRSIKNFECIKCGECCKDRSIPITYWDVVRWEREGRLDIIQEVKFVHYADPSGIDWYYFYNTALRGDICSFLMDDNKCMIHETKPVVCKNYPFNARSEEMMNTCLGIGKGKIVKLSTMKNINRIEESAFLLTSQKIEEMEKIIIKMISGIN